MPASLVVEDIAALEAGSVAQDWVGRSVVEVLDTGRVVMVYYAGAGHAENAGALHIKFSDDYGATWSAEDRTLTGKDVSGFPMNPPDCAPGEDANEPMLYQTASGALLVHMWRNDWFVSMKGTYQSKSMDGGLTWTTPIPLPLSGVVNTDYTFLTDDYFVLDGVIYAGGRETSGPINTQYRCALYKTEDEGGSWSLVSYITKLNIASEVGLEYLGNRTIIAIMRAQSNNHTYRCISTDLGATWGALEEITWNVPESGRHRLWTQQHIEQSAAQWWDDKRLLMCGFVFTKAGRRSALWLSKDRGATWSEPFWVDGAVADGGYGDVLYNPVADQYVYLNYRGTSAAASLAQYTVKVDWGT